MKRLILTSLFSIAITIAALIPLIWAGSISVAQAKESPDHSAVSPQETQKPAAAQTSKVRLWLAHLAPFATAGTAVTVTVNGTDLLTDFEFGDVTPGYIAIDSGLTQIEIFRKSDGAEITSDTLSLAANTDYTIAVIGSSETPMAYDEFDLYIVDSGTGTVFDDNTPPGSGDGNLRIVHLAPFGGTITETEVDILDENGDPLNGLEDVRYETSSGYFSLPADSYDLTISALNGFVTQSIPITIGDGQIVTVFAIGDIPPPPAPPNGNQPVQILPVVYSGPEAYVAHVAPFDAVTATTAVTVSVNGSAAITNFTYGETSGDYVPLTLGDNIIDILLPNGATAMSGTFNLTPTKYTIAAIGDNDNQPLELFQLFDEEALSTTAKVRIVHAAPFTGNIAATGVDILNQDGSDLTPPLNDIAYKDFTSPYLQLPAGTYDLKINLADTMTTVIDIPALDIVDGDIWTIFAIGDGTNQELHFLTIPELDLVDDEEPTIYLPTILKA